MGLSDGASLKWIWVQVGASQGPLKAMLYSRADVANADVVRGFPPLRASSVFSASRW